MPFSLHGFPASFQRRFPDPPYEVMAVYPMQTVFRFSRCGAGFGNKKIATQRSEPDHPFRDSLGSGSLCSDKKVKKLALLRCANVNLSGRGPSILLRKTVLSLKSPTGAFIAPLRCANANLSGRGPSILLRKTVLSLKSPTGAFIAPLRFANANF